MSDWNVWAEYLGALRATMNGVAAMVAVSAAVGFLFAPSLIGVGLGYGWESVWLGVVQVAWLVLTLPLVGALGKLIES